eukprot:m.51794 g.51794  ORF g.51794 m.51794 type:complete len:1358 (+) comp13024_c0_seq1:162-4235(+)
MENILAAKLDALQELCREQLVVAADWPQQLPTKGAAGIRQLEAFFELEARPERETPVVDAPSSKSSFPTEEELKAMKVSALKALYASLEKTQLCKDIQDKAAAEGRNAKEALCSGLEELRPKTSFQLLAEKLTPAAKAYETARLKVLRLAAAVATETVSAAAELKCLADLPVAHVVLSCVEAAAERKCNIVVMGETSTGKSTFNNILLGTPLFSTSEGKCTARIWECVYGEQITLSYGKLKLYGHGYDFKPANVQFAGAEYPCKVIEKYEKDHDEPQDHIGRITHPAELLRLGTNIFDTPGINQSVAEEDLLRKALKDAVGIMLLIGKTGTLSYRAQTILESACSSMAADSDSTYKLKKSDIFVILNRLNEIEDKIIDNEIQEGSADAERAGIRMALIEEVKQFTRDGKWDEAAAFCQANLMGIQQGLRRNFATKDYEELCGKLARYINLSFRRRLHAILAKMQAAVQLQRKALDQAQKDLGQEEEVIKRELHDEKKLLDKLTANFDAQSGKLNKVIDDRLKKLRPIILQIIQQSHGSLKALAHSTDLVLAEEGVCEVQVLVINGALVTHLANILEKSLREELRVLGVDLLNTVVGDTRNIMRRLGLGDEISSKDFDLNLQSLVMEGSKPGIFRSIFILTREKHLNELLLKSETLFKDAVAENFVRSLHPEKIADVIGKKIKEYRDRMIKSVQDKVTADRIKLMEARMAGLSDKKGLSQADIGKIIQEHVTRLKMLDETQLSLISLEIGSALSDYAVVLSPGLTFPDAFPVCPNTTVQVSNIDGTTTSVNVAVYRLKRNALDRRAFELLMNVWNVSSDRQAIHTVVDMYAPLVDREYIHFIFQKHGLTLQEYLDTAGPFDDAARTTLYKKIAAAIASVPILRQDLSLYTLLHLSSLQVILRADGQGGHVLGDVLIGSPSQAMELDDMMRLHRAMQGTVVAPPKKLVFAFGALCLQLAGRRLFPADDGEALTKAAQTLVGAGRDLEAERGSDSDFVVQKCLKKPGWKEFDEVLLHYGLLSREAVLQDQQRKIRVLCLDGGGAQGSLGFCESAILHKIEQRAGGRRISELFDVVCGSGFGGYLALSLAYEGKAAMQCMADCHTFATQTLQACYNSGPWLANARDRERYDAGPLQQFFAKFGPARMLDCQTKCKVVLLAKENNAAVPHRICSFATSRLGGGPDWFLRDAAYAVCATTPYFLPYQDDSQSTSFSDGKFCAGVATLIALSEALNNFPDDLVSCVVSIGPGPATAGMQAQHGPGDTQPQHSPSRNQAQHSLSDSLDGMLNDVTEASLKEDLRTRLTDLKSQGGEFYRLNPTGQRPANHAFNWPVSVEAEKLLADQFLLDSEEIITKLVATLIS